VSLGLKTQFHSNAFTRIHRTLDRIEPERNHVQIKSDAFGNQFAGCPIKSWELKSQEITHTHNDLLRIEAKLTQKNGMTVG